MDEMQKARLISESDKGQRASYVLEMYLGDFIKKVESELTEAFFNSVPDPDQLMEVKRLSMALGAIKARVQKDIDDGKMADKLLAESKPH